MPASSVSVLAGLVGLHFVEALVVAFDCRSIFVQARPCQQSKSQINAAVGLLTEPPHTLSPSEVKKPQQRLRGTTHHHHGEKHNEDCGRDEEGMSLACASYIVELDVSE